MVNLESYESQEKLVCDKEELQKQYDLLCLPPDLLHLIFSKGVTCARHLAVCRLVCKRWQSFCFPPLLTPFDHNLDPLFPGLIHHLSINTIKYRNFVGLSGTYSLDIGSAKIRCAKYGWLLMSREFLNQGTRYQESFLLNPSSNKRNDLPNSSCFLVMSLTAPPDSANCLVLGLNDHYGILCTHRLGERDWKGSSLHWVYFGIRCKSRDSHHVLRKGLCYSLNHDLSLCVFHSHNQQYGFYYKNCIQGHNPKSILEAFLVEDKGKLYAVLIYKNKKDVHVLKWDNAVKIFTPVKNLENTMIFISGSGSFCQKAVVKEMGNKIYFPNLFRNGSYTFYSLATKKYHSFFNGNFCVENYYDLEENRNYFWFKMMIDEL